MKTQLSNRLQQLDKAKPEMKKFLLLTPVDHDDFEEFRNNKDLIDFLKSEYKCGVLKSLNASGVTKLYVTSTDQQSLLELCEEVGLDGAMVEYGDVFDQEIA